VRFTLYDSASAALKSKGLVWTRDKFWFALVRSWLTHDTKQNFISEFPRDAILYMERVKNPRVDVWGEAIAEDVWARAKSEEIRPFDRAIIFAEVPGGRSTIRGMCVGLAGVGAVHAIPLYSTVHFDLSSGLFIVP
jgi:hypothetical protein